MNKMRILTKARNSGMMIAASLLFVYLYEILSPGGNFLRPSLLGIICLIGFGIANTGLAFAHMFLPGKRPWDFIAVLVATAYNAIIISVIGLHSPTHW